jgi:hypothetical protein
MCVYFIFSLWISSSIFIPSIFKLQCPTLFLSPINSSQNSTIQGAFALSVSSSLKLLTTKGCISVRINVVSKVEKTFGLENHFGPLFKNSTPYSYQNWSHSHGRIWGTVL